MTIATSFLASAARFAVGGSVGPIGPRPQKMLELYEFEACPFCRKVREALTIFDLDALIHPCPKGGTRFRPEAEKKGGKAQFPYLVDPNTGTSLYESDAIIRYLSKQYGDGTIPLPLKLGPLTTMSAMMASAARPGRGGRARASKRPDQPLELWSFEVSPYCRIARETLSSLEIPYVLHNVGKGSPKREAFVAKSGKMMVPYLVDPNTGKSMFESSEIVRYLESTYGAS